MSDRGDEEFKQGNYFKTFYSAGIRPISIDKMDDGGDGSHFVEIPEHNDYIIFAEDFVDSVMVQRIPNYNIWTDSLPFRKFVSNPFDETFQRVIGVFITKVGERNVEIFQNMWNNVEVTSFRYRQFVNELDLNIFKINHFDAGRFLLFCTGISDMAALFYANAVITAPLIAKAHIVETLQNRMPADGWDVIHKAADILVNNENKELMQHYRLN